MEEQKQVSNNELLAVINEVKSQMVTKDVFDTAISKMVTKDVFDTAISKMVTKDVFDTAISKMVTKDVFESMISDFAGSLNFITQNAATEVQLMESEARIRKEIDFMHYDLPSKDFVTTKVAELRGSFVEAFKNSNAKTNKLSEILLQRKVINESDDREVSSMVPFPRPKMI